MADLDLTNVTKLTVSGGASASGTTDAGCGTSTSYKLDNTSGTTWNTTSMTGTHTLYMYASLRASGPHQDQWVYKCTSWHSTSSIKANTIFIDE